MEKTNVLIIGSGAREHALGWKILQSPLLNKLFYAPGNGGTNENITIDPYNFEKLIEFAKHNDCLTIVGPEEFLTKGIVDRFEDENLPIFGPRSNAAKLESSKIFAKLFMKENSIPTADFEYFDDKDKAVEYANMQNNPVVVKADGLAAGKGVIVCNNGEEAVDAIERLMVKREFNDAGKRIIIERRIYGEEFSFIGICDGKKVIPLDVAQDHKRLLDGDQGPNTGGMGSYSPVPFVNAKLYDDILENIMIPTIEGMEKTGLPFKGFLYAGIMLDGQTQKPYVLEYNVRMGDPECQSILPRMKSDLLKLIISSISGSLGDTEPIRWSDEFSLSVVLASKGYPGNYSTGHEIRGLNSNNKDTITFHAGTLRKNGNVYTNGGRVISITGLDKKLEAAIDKAYQRVKEISWGDNEQYFRTDIGRRFINY